MFEPQLQRYREYARQRQMTLGDLLLENRIVFLGSSPETAGRLPATETRANKITRKRHRLNEILARHTGQPMASIEKETDRDRYFSAEDAKAFGLVDEVLAKVADEKKK